MEQELSADPDVIIVPSGGTVPYTDAATRKLKYRSTTYEERDAFGTLGGFARVEAAAILAKQYPLAHIITTSKRGPGEPSHAQIQADELVALGVERGRVILEEQSHNTASQLSESLRIARENGWQRILIVSNEYHLARSRALCGPMGLELEIGYCAAEDILAGATPGFAEEFSRIKQQSSYHERLISEARGLSAIESGEYARDPTRTEDKKERLK